jgi:hypothetical protein
MDEAIAKTNARWKLGLLLAFAGALWLFHLTTAVWFVAHSVPCEGVVMRREEHTLRRKRFWAKLEVAYADANGRPVTGTIRWQITPPPVGQKITVWRADSGVIKVGPASWVETFFFETMIGFLALCVGAVFVGAKIFLKPKVGRRRMARKP